MFPMLGPPLNKGSILEKIFRLVTIKKPSFIGFYGKNQNIVDTGIAFEKIFDR